MRERDWKRGRDRRELNVWSQRKEWKVIFFSSVKQAAGALSYQMCVQYIALGIVFCSPLLRWQWLGSDRKHFIAHEVISTDLYLLILLLTQFRCDKALAIVFYWRIEWVFRMNIWYTVRNRLKTGRNFSRCWNDDFHSHLLHVVSILRCVQEIRREVRYIVS